MTRRRMSAPQRGGKKKQNKRRASWVRERMSVSQRGSKATAENIAGLEREIVFSSKRRRG